MQIVSVSDAEGVLANRVPPVSLEARAFAAGVIDDVAARGDEAVLELTLRFDGVRLDGMHVSEREFSEALKAVPPALLKAVRESCRNVKRFTQATLPKTRELKSSSGLLAKRVVPLDCVGAYVPGGKAAYPSSVVMTAAVAKAAGVKRVIVCTPPGRDGRVNPFVLAACREAGVDDVFKAGGSQAIAAMAVGTKTIPRVDKIVGPGNRFVSAAKAEVAARGLAAIDSPAGPSEVLVIAGEGAKARLAAMELVVQAEHAQDSFCCAVCWSRKLALEITREVESLAAKASRKDIVRESLAKGAVFIAAGESEALSFANKLAVEHVRVLGGGAERIAARVTNAGAVFVGDYSPVAAGDYSAGPSHVLPTGGAARFCSGLSASSFVKEVSVIRLSKGGLAKLAGGAALLARAEGLDSHAESLGQAVE